MTETSRQRLANKIIKAKKYDKEVKTEYNSYWVGKIILYGLVAAVYFIVFSLIHKFCRPTTYAGWLFATIFIDIPVVFIMLMGQGGPKLVKSDGRIYRNFFGFISTVVCYFFNMVPVMYVVYYFNYDVATDTCDLPFWKIVIYAPILFIVVTAISVFYDTKMPYSGGSQMTINDRKLLRQTQSIAGIDPDKVPMIVSDRQAKEMTINDWKMLGLELKLAGYNIFK